MSSQRALMVPGVEALPAAGTRSRWRSRPLLAAIMAVDAAVANLSILLAFLARFEGALPQANWAAVGVLWLPTTLALLACYLLVGLYGQRRDYSRPELVSMVARGNALWLFASVVIAYVHRDVAGAYPTAVLFLTPAFNAVLSYWIHAGWQPLRRRCLDPGRARRAVLVGSSAEARRLSEAASTQPGFQYEFAAVVEGVKGLDLARVAREVGAEKVILADPGLETRDLLHCLVQCAGLPVRFKVVPSIFEVIRAHRPVTVVAGVPLADLFGDEVPTMREVARRVFDVLVACLGIAVTLPLWPIVAIAVKASSSGPVWYSQERVGLHGRSFRLLKFRTMRADAESRTGPVLASLDDHRVTAVGHFLRVTHLDELPQLVNVVLGEMSIVGPRPERPAFVRQFLRSVPAYAQRYSVRPGITGLAQVRGSYDISARNKARYDLVYLENRSLLLDLKILAMTVGVVLSGRGAR